MKNIKTSIICLLFLLTAFNSIASESDDFSYVDNLYKQRDFKNALSASEKFLQKYPNSKHRESMLDKIAKLYFLEKKYDKVIEIYKKLYVNESKKSLKDEYAYYMVKSYALLGDSESLRFYLKNISSKKIYEKSLYEAGVGLVSKDKNEDAILLFNEIINNKYSYYQEALLNMGLANYNLRNYDKAIFFLDEYKKKNKENVDLVNYLKASSLYKKNNEDEAISYFNELVEKKLNSVYGKKSILTLIEIYANRKDLEKVNYYLNMIQGTKEYNSAMIMLGDLYVTKEKYKEALNIYKQSNDSSNPRLIYGEAYSLYKLERYNEALEKFEKLKNTDYYNQAIYHIFAIHYKLKNYQKIIDNRDVMKKVVVTQTDTDNINTIIANSAYQLGNYKLAKDYYGRLFAISLKKENLFRVILLDSQILDMDDLNNRFRQYKENFPDDTEFKKDIYLYTGDANYKAGDLEKAEYIYKEYLDREYNFEILSSLMVTLLDQKKYDEMDYYLSQVKDEDKLNYLKGISSIGLAKYEEAEQFFKNALSLENTDSNLRNKIYLNRVRNYFLWGKYNDAIKVGKEIISEGDIQTNLTVYSEILDKIALSYFRIENYEEARNYYKKIQSIDGYEVYGKFQIADSYYNQGEYDIAAQLYREIYTNFTETFYGQQAGYKYLSVLSMQNKKEEFEKEKNNFLSVYPDSKLKNSVLNMSANYYTQTKDSTKAIEELNNIKNNTDDSELISNNNEKIVNIKLKSKDYEDIEKYIGEINDEEVKIYYLSRYYLDTKKSNMAIKELEKLTKVEKYKSYANENLGNYFYDKKDYNNAKKYYTELLKDKNNEKDYIIYRMGLMNEKNGNNKAALEYYKKIYEKYKGKYEVDSMLRAADIYDKNENVAEAKKLYFKLYKVKNNKEIHEYTLEKLIFYRLLEENNNEAKKYYNELKKVNPKKAEKFKDYFN